MTVLWRRPLADPARPAPRTLVTSRLTLRPLTPIDADRVAEVAGSLAVAQMAGQLPYPLTPAAAGAWIAGLPAEDVHTAVFAICRGATLIGIAGYAPEAPGVSGLGYLLGEPYWGQGYAREAVAAVVDTCFATAGSHTMRAAHFHDNARSARVLAHLGFTLVGAGHGWCPVRQASLPTLVHTRDAPPSGPARAEPL